MDKKLCDAIWTLCSSDDHHHWLGVCKASKETTIKKLVDNCGSGRQKIWYTVFEANLGFTSTDKQVWKGGQGVYRFMVVHVNHAVARSACRSFRINFADLLLLHPPLFQVMGGDFNAVSYLYFRTGSQQVPASLQDSSLAVMLRRFDEGINAQFRDNYENHLEYQFCSDIYMVYHDEHMKEYPLKRDEIMGEVADAAGESSKIPRRQLFRSLMRTLTSSASSTSEEQATLD